MALSFATKKLLVLFIVFVATLTLGMLIFVAIEGRDGKWGYGDGLRFAVQVVTTIGESWVQQCLLSHFIAE